MKVDYHSNKMFPKAWSKAWIDSVHRLSRHSDNLTFKSQLLRMLKYTNDNLSANLT